MNARFTQAQWRRDKLLGGYNLEAVLGITRRNVVNAMAALTLPAVPLAMAERRGLSLIGQAQAQSAPPSDVKDPGPLPDRILGSAAATVTIIEYSSMTCPHCAEFANTTFVALKKEFIDTGKVQYIAREFPLDDLAAVVAVLIRSVDQDRYYEAWEALFAQQREWWSPRIQPLMAFAIAHLGFTEARFNACLADRELLDRIAQARQRAQTLGVNSTPTFFINGDKSVGYMTVQQMERQIASHLKA